MTASRSDLSPLPGEIRVGVLRPRNPEIIPGLWKAPGRSRGTGLVFHGAPGRSFDERERVVTAALGDLGYGTLRVLFRPIDWIRRPTRSEFRRRLPIARAAVRWVRRSQPDSPILLAGGSIGAMLSARLASSAGARGVVLVSPPFRNRRMGDSYRRWASALDTFAGPKLLVIGDRDDEWAPLDLVRTVIRSWPAPVSLEVIRGAGHGMKGVEDSLRAAILRWGRLQEDRLS